MKQHVSLVSWWWFSSFQICLEHYRNYQAVFEIWNAISSFITPSIYANLPNDLHVSIKKKKKERKYFSFFVTTYFSFRKDIVRSFQHLTACSDDYQAYRISFTQVTTPPSIPYLRVLYADWQLNHQKLLQQQSLAKNNVFEFAQARALAHIRSFQQTFQSSVLLYQNWSANVFMHSSKNSQQQMIHHLMSLLKQSLNIVKNPSVSKWDLVEGKWNKKYTWLLFHSLSSFIINTWETKKRHSKKKKKQKKQKKQKKEIIHSPHTHSFWQFCDASKNVPDVDGGWGKAIK